MFDNITLIVTTRGRVNMQYTLQNLDTEILQFVTLVCYPSEYSDHLKNWGDKVKEIVPHEDWCTNIDAIRFWCMLHFETDYILFMDDNLNFHVRRQSDKGHECKFPLHQVCDKHFDSITILEIQIDMFEWIITNLKSDKYGIVGLNQRSGNNNHVDRDEEENTRVYAFWGINKKLFLPHVEDYMIDPYTFKGDFYTFLFMLTKGHPNICSYKFAFGKTGGANNKGGCSIYRNKEVIEREAYQLQSDFPQFVKIKKKKSKSWKDLDDEIVDVMIQWKKAYEFGLKNKR